MVKYGYSVSKYGYSVTKYGYSVAKYGYSVAKYGYSVVKYGYIVSKYGYSVTKYCCSVPEYGYIVAKYGYNVTKYGCGVAEYVGKYSWYKCDISTAESIITTRISTFTFDKSILIEDHWIPLLVGCTVETSALSVWHSLETTFDVSCKKLKRKQIRTCKNTLSSLYGFLNLICETWRVDTVLVTRIT